MRAKPDVLIVNQGVWYNAQARNRQKQEAELLRSGFHEGITVPLMQRNVTHPIVIWRQEGDCPTAVQLSGWALRCVHVPPAAQSMV